MLFKHSKGVNVKEEDKKKVWELYFDKKYSYSQIMDYFKGKYVYADIKKAINSRYKGL